MEAPVNVISKYLNGYIDAEEKSILKNWRQASIENENYFQEMAYIWSKTNYSLSQQSEDLPVDTEAALIKVHQRMDEGTVVSMPARRRYLSIAASLSILIVAAYFIKQVLSEAPITQIVASADTGQTVTLPDGSTVWMEPSAEIAYSPSFKQGRTIQASGEVFVDVVRDESKPFTVHTPHLSVGVLGTSFVINDIDKGDNASVTVLTGKVSVTDIASDKIVILTKDMTAEYTHESQNLKVADTVRDINHLYEATGELVFVNTTLDVMINQLATITKNRIIIENAELKDCLFKGRFKTKDLDSILKSIQPIYNFSYNFENGEYIIANGFCN